MQLCYQLFHVCRVNWCLLKTHKIPLVYPFSWGSSAMFSTKKSEQCWIWKSVYIYIKEPFVVLIIFSFKTITWSSWCYQHCRRTCCIHLWGRWPSWGCTQYDPNLSPLQKSQISWVAMYIHNSVIIHRWCHYFTIVYLALSHPFVYSVTQKHHAYELLTEI